MIKVINTNTHTVAYYNELTFGKAKHFLAQCLLQQFFLEQHLLSRQLPLNKFRGLQFTTLTGQKWQRTYVLLRYCDYIWVVDSTLY